MTRSNRRSPRARVLLVGYLTYWRPGGCFPGDPYRPADADFIQRTFDRLMTMMVTVAVMAIMSCRCGDRDSRPPPI